MRGDPIAQRFAWDRYNSRGKVDPGGRVYDNCLAIKCDVPPIIRRTAGRIFFDPLDKWFANRTEGAKTPAQWLADEHNRNRFTDLIAATVPMAEAAKRGLPKSVRVHLVPHHADPRVGLDWYDPAGPIVYAGMSKFIEPALETVRRACKLVGREFSYVTKHHAWEGLKGASLVLAPRVGLRTRLNLNCKPTVKIANAAQAGIPVLATDDPAVMSLYNEVRVARVEDWTDAAKLARHLRDALEDKPPALQHSFESWIERMKGITS
tara:strand:- start:120 stop:911 length:792 start_codon:yes stop_codon:yes gene_type:complete